MTSFTASNFVVIHYLININKFNSISKMNQISTLLYCNGYDSDKSNDSLVPVTSLCIRKKESKAVSDSSMVVAKKETKAVVDIADISARVVIQTPQAQVVPKEHSLGTPKGWAWDLDLTLEVPKCVLRLLEEPVIIDLTDDVDIAEPEVKRRRSDRIALLRLNLN